MPPVVQEGLPFPFGAMVRDGGVNFAVFSENAERIELCVFTESGEARYALHGPLDGVFHGFLLGATAGLIYGYRAQGAYAPERGHCFNANKLLLDPYARTIVGEHVWSHAHGGDNSDDNSAIALKAQVCDATVLALDHQSVRVKDSEVVLYEVHVKGFSQTNTDIPEAIRGTYAALAHPTSIAHFKQLGITTLSLLPVQYRLDEPGLAARGATNYWGYNTLGFFCVEPRLSATPHDTLATHAEFRAMVDALHASGLEVVLDVVYNHTPEGDERGATLSFRGLDNANWYRLDPKDNARAENFTGCGNTLKVHHPRVTQFVLDSLRFWVEVMGVDGFRFDLAPVLGRTVRDFDRNAPFFVALKQDPVLSRIRLIAEPWDIGPSGYQVGNFPSNFWEWNDKFRDSVRRYWLGSEITRGELAQRFTASSDLFHHHQRSPATSINYISVHDGFTLMDMVRYGRKHNLANGENNRDGRDDEPCANFGAEGETGDPQINAQRDRVRRAMMMTLLLAQGTPMLCAGDEIGNSQCGNNNPYCLDDETTWLNWDRADAAFLEFTSSVLALRKREPLLRHSAWFPMCTADSSVHIDWIAQTGASMQPSDWQSTHERAFACVMTQRGEAPYRLLLAFNSHAEDIAFTLPEAQWHVVIDSSLSLDTTQTIAKQCAMPARAMVVFRDSQ